MSSSNNENIKKNSYIVVPRGEYEKLNNRQYTELTTSKKKIDPDEKVIWKRPENALPKSIC